MRLLRCARRQPVAQVFVLLREAERAAQPVPEGERRAEVPVAMPGSHGVVDLVLGGGHQESLQAPPVADADMRVAQVGAGRVEGEEEDVRAQDREEIHGIAEEEDEDSHHGRLNRAAAQAEQDRLQRMGAEDRERSERRRRMMDLVKGPEHRPAVKRPVDQVLRQVVGEEVAEREGEND